MITLNGKQISFCHSCEDMLLDAIPRQASMFDIEYYECDRCEEADNSTNEWED